MSKDKLASLLATKETDSSLLLNKKSRKSKPNLGISTESDTETEHDSSFHLLKKPIRRKKASNQISRLTKNRLLKRRKKFEHSDSEADEPIIRKAPKKLQRKKLSKMEIENLNDQQGKQLILFGDIIPTKQQLNFIKRNNGRVIEDYNMFFNIMVQKSCNVKVRFLIAICKGADIVTPKWLKDSIKKKSFQNTAKYILNNKRFEKSHNFSLKRSIKAAQNSDKWLSGRKIWFPRNINPNYEDLQRIVAISGG